MEEIWKDIKEYEGLYQISNFGRIKSLYNNTIRNIALGKKGYYQITLCKNGKKKTFAVHRLVAQSFIPNPNNFPQVNHKDENTKNNNVSNLEWCTVDYNCNYGTRNDRISNSLNGRTLSEKHKENLSAKVLQHKGKKIKCNGQEFNTITDCANFLGTSNQNVSNWVNNKNKPIGKFKDIDIEYM